MSGFPASRQETEKAPAMTRLLSNPKTLEAKRARKEHDMNSGSENEDDQARDPLADAEADESI